MIPSEEELAMHDWACGINYSPYKPRQLPHSPLGYYRATEPYLDDEALKRKLRAKIEGIQIVGPI